MRRLLPILSASLLVLLTSGPVLGQGGTPEPPRFGAPLLAKAWGQAKQGGGLERLFAKRHYLYRMGPDARILVTTRGDTVEEEVAGKPVARLAFESRFLGIGGRVAGWRIDTRYVYGQDGRLSSFEIAQARPIGERRIDRLTRGERVGAELRLVTVDDEPGQEAKESRRSLAWPGEALPLTVAMFFLPPLAERGLPQQLGVRLFQGEDLRLEPQSELRLSKGQGLLRLRCLNREGEERFVAELGKKDEQGLRPLKSLKLEQGQRVMTPISLAEAERLLASTSR